MFHVIHTVLDFCNDLLKNEKLSLIVKSLVICLFIYTLHEVFSLKQHLIKIESVQEHHKKSISDSFMLIDRVSPRLDDIRDKYDSHLDRLEIKYDLYLKDLLTRQELLSRRITHQEDKLDRAIKDLSNTCLNSLIKCVQKKCE